MRAGSSFTNFVTEGNVRQNAQDFNPELYNKVGAVTGYPGPNNGVAAAAGDPGPEIVMKGGRSPSPGPNYHSFEDSADLKAGVYGKNLAPVKVCNNNMCGGRKMSKGKKGKTMKGKKVMKGKKGKTMKTKKSMKGKKNQGLIRVNKTRAKKMMRKARMTSRKYLKDVRDLFRMRGGSPAPVPAGSQTSGHNQYMKVQGGGSPAEVPSGSSGAGSSGAGYHQYMSNQPFSNSYTAGGHLAPAENALANPVLIKPTDNCPPQK